MYEVWVGSWPLKLREFLTLEEAVTYIVAARLLTNYPSVKYFITHGEERIDV